MPNSTKRSNHNHNKQHHRTPKSKSSSSSSLPNSFGPYAQAANLLNQLWSKSPSRSRGTDNNATTTKSVGSLGGLKSVAYSTSGELKCSKATYAQCANVLQHKPLLDQIIHRYNENTAMASKKNLNSKTTQKDKKKKSEQEKQSSPSLLDNINNQGLFYVLLFELLLGPNHSIRGGGSLKRTLLSCHDTLKSILNDILKSGDGNYNSIVLNDGSTSEMTTTMTMSSTTNHTPATTIPRYARVNTLRANLGSVIESLQQKQQNSVMNNDVEKTTKRRRPKTPTLTPTPTIFLDKHVPNLLVLPPTPETRAMLQDFVVSNQIVLQDKSSCFSALCLVHGFDRNDDKGNDDDVHITNNDECGDYLDACAAPGNKTCHLAALIGEINRKQQESQQQERQPDINDNQKKKRNSKKDKSMKNKTNDRINNDQKTITVHALDRSHERFESLKRRMDGFVNDGEDENESSSSVQRMPLSRVKVQCHECDFLKTSQKDFSNVTRILLDPSCSGSGMANHRSGSISCSGTRIATSTGDDSNSNSVVPSYYYPPNEDLKRIESLASFQLVALKHAMTNFENVNKIVYSTCSLYVTENELVVMKALQETQHQEEEDYSDETNNQSNKDDNSRYDKWKLVAPRCLDHWHRRGVAIDGEVSSEQARAMIRVDPTAGDDTNGFFVACLERRRRNPSSVDNMSDSTTKHNHSMLETQNQAKSLNVPLYHGEFEANTGESKTQIPLEFSPCTTDPNVDKLASVHPNSVEADDSKVGTHSISTATASSSDAIVSGKRAKKLAWKQRQRENKRRRLENRHTKEK